MEDAYVKTDGGDTVTLNEATLKTLQIELSGRLLTPASKEYNDARTIWNGMIDRRPGLIVRCLNADDVVQAAHLAAQHQLVLAVRGGGHNIAGNAVCDGGLMIDLSQMKAVQVDADRRSARVEAGATLGDFDRETQAFGLATPLGINSTTGIAGLTLGGGFGWLSRSLGLSIDNLISADIVTATGSQVTACESEHADLFWAIRGGGGNFGIVTSFEFRLHPVGPEVLSGLIVHPLSAARDVLHFYRDFISTAPEEFACWFVLRKAPPLPFLAPEWHGREILVLARLLRGRDCRRGARGQTAPRLRQAAGGCDCAAPVHGVADDSGSPSDSGRPQLLEVSRFPRTRGWADRCADRRGAAHSRSADRDRVCAARRRDYPSAE